MSVQEEFRALLQKHNIPFDERYLWERCMVGRPCGPCGASTTHSGRYSQHSRAGLPADAHFGATRLHVRQAKL